MTSWMWADLLAGLLAGSRDQLRGWLPSGSFSQNREGWKGGREGGEKSETD